MRLYANTPYICKYTFQMLVNWTEKKPFLFLSRISAFQNQNTYYQNFNLIISDSRLFNSNVRIDTYLVQTQAIV